MGEIIENNIFKNAIFGDKFLTRAGKVALYCFSPKLGNACLIEGDSNILVYRYDGLLLDNVETEFDIVSKYQEFIDEIKLDKDAGNAVHLLSTHIKLSQEIPDYENKKEIYKTGYKHGKGLI